MYQNKYLKYKKKYLMAKPMTGGWKDTDVRSFAFWAYTNNDFHMADNPSENYWGITNMLYKYDQKGTKDQYIQLKKKSIDWAILSVNSPADLLGYLDLLDKELGTLDDPAEDEKLKRYIARSVLNFFKAWHKAKFSYKAFDRWGTQKNFGGTYISPATKLKLLYDKYKNLLDEKERTEFNQLMDEFKKVLPEYQKKDIEIQQKDLAAYQAQLDELQRNIANANSTITVNIPKNYNEVWLNRLN